MSFESELFDWIDRSLAEPIDKSVIAFSFDLYEPYGIELIGSSLFDLNDKDWACSEDFVPSKRGIDIPEGVCSGNRQDCLQTMTAFIKTYLASKRPGANVLASAKAVAIGFVDGNLEIISHHAT